MVYEATFQKEFTASQVAFPITYDYESCDPHQAYFHLWSDPYMDRFIHTILENMAWRISKMKRSPILPQVNRRKNVSEPTALLYNQSAPEPLDYVRTLDLEILYHNTGIKVQGECEIRSAWKFNDLKPRFYYAQGGEGYHASKYMKSIAVLMMESIPSTTTDRRRNPQRYLKSLLHHDFVTAWDFEAFTTNLSMLRYFLSAIADGLREKAVYDIPLFDTKEGIQYHDVADMIDEYNSKVNVNAPFTLHRIIHNFSFASDIPDKTYYQQNSGMLGIPGNIGFSTAFHGLEACKIIQSDNCVCVGDDAAAIDELDPDISLIRKVSAIGKIHPEKFDRLGVEEEGPIKFLKRAFSRDANEFHIDYLYNVPISPYVDGVYGTRTVPIDITPYLCAKRISISVGALYWEIYGAARVHEREEDYDINLLQRFLRNVYTRAGLPFTGRLPGATFSPFNVADPIDLKFAIPPLIHHNLFDPRDEDWLEYLCNTTPQTFFSIAMMTDSSNAVRPYPGDEFFCGKTKGLALLEDLGYLEITPLAEIVMILDETNRRRIVQSIKRKEYGLKKYCKVICKKDIPEIFDELRIFVENGPPVDGYTALLETL